MTEGSFQPLTLVPDEVEALDWLLDLLDREWASSGVPQQGSQRAVLRIAVDRARPGSMQTHPGQPVHAVRASQTSVHGTALALCDVDAAGVVTGDRSLVDCDLCLALLADQQRPCTTCHDEGYVERDATPEEVDAGCELGVAYDPCPSCNPDGEGGTANRLAQAMRSAVADAAAAHGMTVTELPQPGVPTVDLLEHDPTVSP